MPNLEVFTIAEQVARHLRGEILAGRMQGLMPGRNELAAELGFNGKTIEAALKLLEKQGLLVGQGAGRKRRIVPPKNLTPPALRLAILDYEPLHETEAYMAELQHLLRQAGHSPFVTEKSLLELKMDVRRAARLVKRTQAEAWVVCSASREVLKWFAGQKIPAFALFGRRKGLPIAGVGPDHTAAGRAAARRLIELGHQRIVVLVRESQRAGGVGPSELSIFKEMEAHGLPVGAYNLPDWEDTPKGFHRVLDELFRLTPPTALIIDEPFLFHAAKDHLARRGILAPSQVSLICRDPDSTFAWCEPSIAHIHWDHRPVLRRIVRWANDIARGKDDRRQSFTKAEYVDGGTVGPVPGGDNHPIPK